MRGQDHYRFANRLRRSALQAGFPATRFDVDLLEDRVMVVAIQDLGRDVIAVDAMFAPSVLDDEEAFVAMVMDVLSPRLSRRQR